MANKRRRTLKKDETLQVNTTGGAVRISHPSSSRGKATARDKAEVVVDLVTPRAVEGFVGFLRENAVVGLAVGIVIGTQLKVIVDSLNTNVINELFKLVLNGDALTTKKVAVNLNGQTANIGWGAVVYSIIDFLFIMIVIYALIKIFKLDKLDKKKQT